MAFTGDLENRQPAATGKGEISPGFHYPDNLSVKLLLHVTVLS